MSAYLQARECVAKSKVFVYLGLSGTQKRAKVSYL